MEIGLEGTLNSMQNRWEQLTKLCDVRRRESFPRYPDMLPDPDNRIGDWLKHTRLVPLHAREWRCRPGWSLKWRKLPDAVWWIFPKSGGWVTLRDGNRRIAFRPGDLILMPEGIEHQIAISTKRTTPQYAGHFYANVFGSVNLLVLLGFPVVTPLSDSAFMQDAAIAMIRDYELKPIGWQSDMESNLMRMLLYVMRHHGRHFGAFNRAYFHSDLPRLFPVFQLIETRMHDPDLTVGELAAHIHVSAVYLRRLFRVVAGKSVVAFIQQQRVRRACILLYQQSHSIKQIAERCGFSDATYFHRIFKRLMAATPVDYLRYHLS